MTTESKSLDSLTKEQVADIAAMLFNFQILGAGAILEMAEALPWLVERAPKPKEMQMILDLAAQGETVATHGRLNLRDTFCCNVKLGASLGLGSVHIMYKAGEQTCGECILCTLLEQFPANTRPESGS